MHAFSATSQHLVRVSLVSDVPDDSILGLIEDVIESHRELDDTQAARGKEREGGRGKRDDENVNLDGDFLCGF